MGDRQCCSRRTKLRGEKMDTNLLAADEVMEILDIIHATLHCQTTEHLQNLVTNMQDLLCCSQSVFCWKSLAPGCLLGAPKILNVSFPEPFLDILDRESLWMDNPIAIRGMQQPGLQSWQETFKAMPPSKKLLDLKHSYDLQNGYSFSVHDKQTVTMFSINDYDPPKLARWQFILDRLMIHFNQAVARITEEAATEKEFPALTGREVEVLSWLKDGKTSWEVSMILEVSERTINFHVANLKKKLNASNRMNAVAQAMHLGLVC